MSVELLALEQLDSGAILLDKNYQVIGWNFWMQTSSGLTREQAIGQDFFILMGLEKKGRIYLAVEQSLEANLGASLSHALNPYPLPLTRNDEAIAQHLSIKSIQLEGRSYCFINVLDISGSVKREGILKANAAKLSQMAEDIKAEEVKTKTIMEHMVDGVFTFDETGKLEEKNRIIKQLLGQSSAGLKALLPGWSWSSLLSIEDQLAQFGFHSHDIWVELEGLENAPGRSFEMSVSRLTLHDQGVFVALLRDITERKLTEARLSAMATRDALTGLANRLALEDRLNQALARSQRVGSYTSVFLLDLNDFKKVNDTYGHKVGDLLLVEVARRLLKVMRKTDTVARLGGDEFCVVLENLQSQKSVVRILEKLLRQLNRPLQIQGKCLCPSASIGVSLTKGDTTADDILHEADIAMYGVKHLPGSNYLVYGKALNESIKAKCKMESGLRKAVELQSFNLHYQPQFDLLDGSICGVEAFLRWQQASPADFVPVLEEMGLNTCVERWVMSQACEVRKKWRETRLVPEKCAIAVNLSACYFYHPDFLSDVSQILTDSGLAPGQLVIELTEASIVKSPEEAIKRLSTLSQLGIKIAVDNFGKDAASVLFLHEFPIDLVKVHQPILAPLERGENKLMLSIIHLAHDLGIKVMAGGVENSRILSQLESKQCDAFQGFLIAKPEARMEFERFVHEYQSKKLRSYLN